jgi:hypothetical protein
MLLAIPLVGRGEAEAFGDRADDRCGIADRVDDEAWLVDVEGFQDVEL